MAVHYGRFRSLCRSVAKDAVGCAISSGLQVCANDGNAMKIYSNVPAVLFLTSCLDSHQINSLTVDVCFMGYLHYGSSACFAEIENKLLNACLFAGSIARSASRRYLV